MTLLNHGPQLAGRLTGLAGHRLPHLEFLDHLVQGQVHDKLLRMFPVKFPAESRQEGAVHIPGDRLQPGQARKMRAGFGPMEFRRGGPVQVGPPVQVFGVLVQRQCHAAPEKGIPKDVLRVSAGQLWFNYGRTATPRSVVDNNDGRRLNGWYRLTRPGTMLGCSSEPARRKRDHPEVIATC